MQILVLGGDGYLGWPTALHLSALDHEVAVCDNFARRGYDDEMGVESLIPIATLDERVAAWREISGKTIKTYVGDLCDAPFVHGMVADFRPDTIVHFGEQRAAPYSMISQAHAVYTQTNNVVGNLNVMYAIADIDRDIHLVKLGTMGEYGQPNIDIEEGWIEIEHKGRKDRMIYPKRPGLLLPPVQGPRQPQHRVRLSDLGTARHRPQPGRRLRADTEQTKLDDRLATRFDYDGVFGTVLNRLVSRRCWAIRSRCTATAPDPRPDQHRRHGRVHPAGVRDPAERGEFRVFNQLTESMSINQIAETIANEFPGEVTIEHVDNPRVEIYDHYYKVVHTALEHLGLKPTLLSTTLIDHLFDVVERYRDRVDTAAIMPTVRWSETTSELPRRPARWPDLSARAQ